MSTLPSVVYRTETFPGLGFLLKKSFFDASMRHHMDDCCMNRSAAATAGASQTYRNLGRIPTRHLALGLRVGIWPKF